MAPYGSCDNNYRGEIICSQCKRRCNYNRSAVWGTHFAVWSDTFVLVTSIITGSSTGIRSLLPPNTQLIWFIVERVAISRACVRYMMYVEPNLVIMTFLSRSSEAYITNFNTQGTVLFDRCLRDAPPTPALPYRTSWDAPEFPTDYFTCGA